MSDPNGVKVVFIKKKAKGHGHHGGAWKVAYADFVTAMMALFIVLWLLTQSDQASKEKIAEYFRTGALPGGALLIGKPGGNTPPEPINLFTEGAGATQAVESKGMRELAKAVKRMIGRSSSSDPQKAQLAKHVRVRVVNEGALIELVEGGDNFLFNVASAELKPGAVQILEQLAPMLAGLENKIEIHGHTDARPFTPGSKQSNWQLSFERGDNARRVLEGKGVEKGKIQSVLAHADTALYNPDDPLAPENRRLSLLVIRQSAQRSRAGLAGEGQGGKKALEEEDSATNKRDADEDMPKKRSLEDEDEGPPKKRSLEDDEVIPKQPSLEDEDEDMPRKRTRVDDDDDDMPTRSADSSKLKRTDKAEPALPALGASLEAIRTIDKPRRRSR